MTPNIRNAAADDAAGMARVKVDTWRVAYRGIIADDFLNELSYAEAEERFRNGMSLSAPGEQFLVAEDASCITGFVIFGPERAVAARDRGEIYAVYVHPEHQGKGLGRMLVTAAVNRMLEQGIRSMTVWTLEQGHSRAFYEYLGGRLASSKIAHIGGVGYTHVAYCWSDLRTIS